jgi:hypothetical protein
MNNKKLFKALHIPAVCCAALWTLPAAAQPAATNTPAPPAIEDAGPGWEFSASAYFYIVPDAREYVQPTLTADRDWLHVEARYNYEGLDTGSAWLGYNFGGEGPVSWSVIPMLGGVFGEISGIAPGYRGSVGWWKLELYAEGEYVVDVGDSSESFFYQWSELTVSPWDWLRLGLVTQRTRLYDSDREIQRGLLLGFSIGRVDLSGYIFNPDDSDPIYVTAVTLSF